MIKRRRRSRKKKQGEIAARNRGCWRGVVFSLPPRMEDPMCWEMDYYWFAEQQKAQEKEQKKDREKQQQAQRAVAIDKLLSEANQQAEKPGEAAPTKETAPAK
jgi:hypothetical protein